MREKKGSALAPLPGVAWYMVDVPPKNDSVPDEKSDRKGKAGREADEKKERDIYFTLMKLLYSKLDSQLQ